MTVATLIIAAGLALVHLFGMHLKLLDVIPRSRWLSLAGGASVAYVFVHLLPELQAGQQHVEQLDRDFLNYLEHHVYLMALIGFATFYGIERMALLVTRRDGQAQTGAANEKAARQVPLKPAGVFWLHIGTFGVYNMLIGYLLLHRETSGTQSLIFFSLAMGLHMLVNDHGLRDHHRHRYDRIGRWLLAAAILAGWALGMMFRMPDGAIAALFGLLGGAIILNVIKEELPNERQSTFWAFCLGAALYAALLLAAD